MFNLPELPGLRQVGFGFDRSAWSINTKQVVQFRYDPSSVWVNPHYPELRYMKPREFHVVTVPASQVGSSVSVYRSLNKYRIETVITQKKKGLFKKKKKTYRHVETELATGNKAVAIAEQLHELYWVR